MIRVALVMMVCALAWSSDAFGQAGDRLDLQAYKPVTLEKLFSDAPRSRDAAVELLAADQLARIEATWTGKQRQPNANIAPLLNAWGESRQRKDGRHLSKFPELEFEEGGKHYWLLAGYPAALSLEGKKAGQRLALLVHRIGFAHGRPVMVILIMATPEQMRAALQAPPPLAPKEPARPPVTAYTTGQASFVHAGKPYTLALTPLNNPETGKPWPNPPSYYSRHTDSQGGTFHSAVLDFGVPGPVQASISMMVPGPGDFATDAHRVHVEVNVMMRGALTTLRGSDFPGCKWRIAQVETRAVKVRLACPQRPPGLLSELELHVSQ